jgi:hypothetical protein
VKGGKAGTTVEVRLSEELVCQGCASGKGCNTCNFANTTKQILYPMRTGNTWVPF